MEETRTSCNKMMTAERKTAKVIVVKKEVLDKEKSEKDKSK